MKIIGFVNEKPRLLRVLAAICVLLAIVPMALCVFGNPLTCDEAYYLSIMERVVEGKRLYYDVNTDYTPMWFCLMAVWKCLFRIPSGSAELYYVFHFLMLFLVAYLLYRIIVSLNINKKIAFLCSWFFVVMSHWMQGNLLNLEVSSLMFGLLSIWMTMGGQCEGKHWKAFIGGMAAACAFLCKQYGFGFVLLDLVWMLLHVTNVKKDFAMIGLFVLGAVAPLLVCWMAWGRNIVVSTLFNGYGTSIDESYGRSATLKLGWVVQAYKVLCSRVALALPVSLLFIPICIRAKRWRVVLFAWLGIAGFMLQYYFAYGAYHYMLYVLPFVVILFAIVLSFLATSRMWLRIVFSASLFITIGYSLYADYYNKVWKLYLHSKFKQKEIVLSEEVKKRLPEGATLWIPNSGVFFVHFYANLTPPNLSTIGYSFGDNGLTMESAIEQAHAADFILSFDWEPAEVYYTKELKEFIYSHEEVYADTTWDVVLHDMSRLKEK